MKSYESDGDDFDTDLVTKLTDYSEGDIYCECALVSYLHRHYDDIPAFSYVGVSKLSCRPCSLWLQALSRSRGCQTFQTRGSHGKCYRGWTRPSLGDETVEQDVDGLFVAALEETLSNMIEKKLIRATAESDSSASSAGVFVRLKAGKRAQRGKILGVVKIMKDSRLTWERFTKEAFA